MKKNRKISKIFTATLAGVFLTSPFSYVQAEEEVGSSVIASEKPSVELPETTEERTTTTKTTTEEKVVITRWEDESGKELKPEKEGKTSAPAGKVEGYEFVETNDTDPEVVIHIFKKKEEKEIITKWEDTEGKELKKPEKGKEEKKHGDIEGYNYDRTTSKDGETIIHIFKKEDKSSDSDKKDDAKQTEVVTTKKEETTKSADKITTKSNDKPETTSETTKAGESTKKADNKVTENVTTSAPTTTENTKVTTATVSGGVDVPLTSTTTITSTQKGSKDIEPQQIKERSIFVNEKGEQIINGSNDKNRKDIDGYEFIRTESNKEPGLYVHIYKEKNAPKNTGNEVGSTIWVDMEMRTLKPSKIGEHAPGSIQGYKYVMSRSSKTAKVEMHIFEKVEDDKAQKVKYNWAYHVDVDTNQLIYFDSTRSGYYHPVNVPGYVYVDTDTWVEKGFAYHTHYYKRVSKIVETVDPSQVFTVWLDEYYNPIVPSRMGSHEAGEFDGYEFEKTVSVNNGYGVAHIFKKVDGEDRLVGKDTDKSVGYRVRSLLPRTSATGKTNYLPLGIAGVVGAAAGAGIYYVLRRKNNNQNNNNFPPFSGQ